MFNNTPPPGFNALSAIEPSFTLLLIGLPLTSILVPILFLILFFSTHKSRRTWLFAVNVLIVLLGIVEGILNAVIQSSLILKPLHSIDGGLFITYISVAFTTPILVDSVLILRLSSVYPPTLTALTTRIAILSVPVACTIARFAVVNLFVQQWARMPDLVSGGLLIWPRNPMVIADWSIQLFENFYCSGLFLIRLRGHRALTSRMYKNQTFASRLHTAFYVAISNFVFPALFSIVQLGFVVNDPSIIHGAIVLTVNNYLSIIGVLFSTLWCSSSMWKGAHNNTPNEASPVLPQSMVTLSGIAPNLGSGVSDQHQFSNTSTRSRGHRTHPLANFWRPYSYQTDSKQAGLDMSLRSPSIIKEESDITGSSFLQPYALSRIGHAKYVEEDESDVESVGRSSNTPRDSGASSEDDPKQWRAVEKGEGGESRGQSMFSGEASVETEMVFASPPPSERGRNARRHSVSVSGEGQDLGDILRGVAPGRRARLSESDRFLRMCYNSGRPPPGRTRQSFMEWSDSLTSPSSNGRFA